MGTRVTTSKSNPADLVMEIRSIYAQWRAGEISQEDALFAIGDCLEDPPPEAAEEAETKLRH